MKETITKDKISLCLNKFSQLGYENSKENTGFDINA